jgi:hypothetical protein
MAIEIQQASRLGELYKTLDLNSKDRIAITKFDANGQLEIWDLESGRYFTISILPQPATIDETHREVPEWLRGVFATPTDDLLSEWHATWEDGAGDRRMTLFGELTYRGVKIPATRLPV